MPGADQIVLWITAAIAAFSIVTYSMWTSRIRKVRREIQSLYQCLEKSDLHGNAALDCADEVVKDRQILSLLSQTRTSLFDLPGDIGPRSYSLRSYHEIWNVRSVLAGRVNLALFEAMPNLLIGFGLMCTFYFLANALSSARSALGSQDLQAINDLLSNAGAKFWTSIVGLLCSLLWNWFSKRSLNSLDADIEILCSALGRKAEDTGAEASVVAQMALLNEILVENREQVGQLRRFETDFAVSIAKAMDNALQPAFQRLTEDLTNAINSLTARVGSMNEDALQKMLTDFSSNLRDLTGSEMTEFKNALLQLSSTLQTSGQDLARGVGEAAGKMSEDLRRTGEEVGSVFANSSESFRQAAAVLEQAINAAKESVSELDGTVRNASRLGTQGAATVTDLLDKLSGTVRGLEESLGSVNQAITVMENVAGDLADTADGLDDTIESQREMVRAVRETAPAFRESLSQAAEAVRIASDAAQQSLGQVRSHLSDTASALDTTVVTLRDGVKDYTDQVAGLHSRLDDHLGTAIQKLGGAITTLDETLDDFIEEVASARSDA